MKAIIPTGGRGTRMQPLTFSTNKHFIPIANKPLIHYSIEAVAKAGIKQIAITYNPGWEKYVKEKLGTGRKWGVKFTYVLQENPVGGLANIFQVCEEFVGKDKFLMHLGDNIFTKGIKHLVDYFEKENPDGLITAVEREDNARLGVPRIGKNNRLLQYIEKPKKPPNNLAIPGIYFFKGSVFECFKGKDKIKPSKRGEYEIGSPYNWLIKHKFKVDVIKYSGKWLDPGKFNDWIEANQYVLDNNTDQKIESKLDKNTAIKNRVKIGKKCKIVNSKIRGPVIIGDRVTLVNAYIGPYTSVSNGCLVENSHVENSVLMENVQIKNIKQPIDESLIGTGAEIYDEDGPTDWIKLFIGEKSRVKI